MTRTIRFDPVAQAEILNALDYVETRKAGLARGLAKCIHGAVEKIREHPQSYPIFYGPYRRFRVDPFKYAMVYRVDANDTIGVVGFVHLMQDPDRLKKRFGD